MPAMMVLALAGCPSGETGTNPIIPRAAVEAVEVQPGAVGPLAPGGSAQLIAVVTDPRGNVLTDRVVTWATSTPGVATVSSAGLVTAVAPGTATISAVSEGKVGNATVTVRRPVASVVVNPATLTLAPGSTSLLSAVVKDALGNVLTDRSLAWASANTGVATVSAFGTVTAVAPGTGLIVATSEGVSGNATVVVQVPVATVAVSPASANLTVGSTQQLSATARDASGNVLTGRAVTWSSNATAVATVSSSGVVTAAGVLGIATITATIEGRSGAASITVAPVPVATVAVSPASASITVGGAQQLAATARDAAGNVLTGRAVTWSSGNTGVATVSASGIVTGVGTGTATITATSEGRSGTASITVTAVPVATVSVSPASASITVGRTQQLAATARDAAGNVLTGRAVTWSSGNTGVATVSGSGVVTGVGTGTATITATSEGRSGTASITVTAVPVATVAVSPASASLTVGSTQQLSAVARDAAGNALTGRAVTWSSGNTGVATVSASGVVTGVGTGTATITATSEGRSGTATITVSAVAGSCQTVSLPVGSSLSGSLATGDCVLTGGVLFDRYRIDLTSTTALATRLSSVAFPPASILTSATGGSVGQVGPLGSATLTAVEWLLPAGLYDLLVTSASSSSTVGAYQLSVAAVAADTASCGVRVLAAKGVSIARQLTTADCSGNRSGPEDRIYVYLEAGQRLTARMSSILPASSFDSYLTLFDASGQNLLAWNDDGDGYPNALLTYTATTSAYFQVRPTEFHGRTGSYTITLSW